LIQRTVKDPRNKALLAVKCITDRVERLYDNKEGVDTAIQGEYEVIFIKAHSAPMPLPMAEHKLLAEKLRYLDDEELTRQIIIATFDIPIDLDPAPRLIIEEIRKIGMELVNSNGNVVEQHLQPLISITDTIKYPRCLK